MIVDHLPLHVVIFESYDQWYYLVGSGGSDGPKVSDFPFSPLCFMFGCQDTGVLKVPLLGITTGVVGQGSWIGSSSANNTRVLWTSLFILTFES